MAVLKADGETKQATPEVIQNIDLSMIVCSPFNPRKYRSEEDVEELEITILENLQRRDINPVEEAVSFGKLMEVLGYSMEDLVKQFGKTDKYIRSRLQLRNLTDEVSELLVSDEITLGVALELARFCPDIQKDVYREHLSADDSYSWKHLQAKEFRKLLEKGYSADLSNYEFDKSDCINCKSNSSICDLFADGNCGLCQNMECLRYKQAGFMAAEATRLLNEKKNAAICIAPNSFISAEVANNLMDTGYEIYEMSANRLPSEPEKPVVEKYTSEAEYQAAEASYETDLQRYKIHSAQIETMIEQGKAQLLVDVSRRKPELCYRMIPETETQQPEEKDTVEKLRNQDNRNREIAIEKAVEDVKHLVREKPLLCLEFQLLEEELLYYIMLSSLRKENYGMLGFNTQFQLSAEEKAVAITSLSPEQKDVIRRDFIVKHLSDTFGNCKQSQLLLEFAALHFPDKVMEIKEQYNEIYKKRHIRIEERIRELQPFTDSQEAETIPDPETFDDSGMDDIPLYPGLPEEAQIGEIQEEKETAA